MGMIKSTISFTVCMSKFILIPPTNHVYFQYYSTFYYIFLLSVTTSILFRIWSFLFSVHLAHKARKIKQKLSHATKSHIQKIAWFRHLSLSIQAQKKKKQQLRTSRSGVRVPPSAPSKKTSQNVMSFLLSQEGQSLGISCHWHDIFILPPLQARQKKHCELQCFFFFYTAIETLSFSHFFNCSQSPTFLQIKNYIRFLWPQTKISSKGTYCGVLFDSYTKILSQFRILKSFYNTVDNFFHLMV